MQDVFLQYKNSIPTPQNQGVGEKKLPTRFLKNNSPFAPFRPPPGEMVFLGYGGMAAVNG
jgi:hypothetical protein